VLSIHAAALMLALCLQPTNDQLDWALVLVQEYANGGSLLSELQSGWMKHADTGAVDLAMVLQVRRQKLLVHAWVQQSPNQCRSSPTCALYTVPRLFSVMLSLVGICTHRRLASTCSAVCC
jgi:hypothetical protein